MPDKKFSRERLQCGNLKLPVKKQEILFYFTKDDAKIVNSMMSKVSSTNGNSTVVEVAEKIIEDDKQDSRGETKEATL